MNLVRPAVLALALIATGAHAGRSCENKPPKADAIQRSMALAEHTAQTLDQSGAQVVALARIGQNLGEYGVRYSHFGFAYREGDKWRVVHKLNQCGTAHAAVYRQGLGEFFLDDLYEYEAGVVVPTPEIQAKLLPVLRDNAKLAQLNTPAYSMVAYPWARMYQQSNQWALETLAMALEPAAQSRERAQAWLQLKDYTPTTLHISPMKRLGGRMTAANIAFDDHPNEKRFTDRIETVTVDSVFAWLNRTGMGAPVQVIR
ncbi:MAG: DUF2145 domain-containing protein [Burkholderiales bacterium]